jgi:uncharacterized protein (TIGR03437 family)
MNRFLLFSFLCPLMLARVDAVTPRKQLLSHLPLRFEENRNAGSPGSVSYRAHGGSFELTVRPTESWLETRGGRVRMALGGANSGARMEPLDRLPGAANYFLGGEKNWKTDVTGYGRIQSSNVYPGIDLIFHGEGGRLEYDFILAPHADPSSIRLEFSGERRLRVDDTGDLVIGTDAGEIRWKRPEIYQDINGKRTPVAGHFVLNRSRVRFEIAAYDRTRSLTVDPSLAYATYLGGAANEYAKGIGLDSAGNIYIAGTTSSNDLPTTSALQRNFGGAGAGNPFGDAFVAKFSPAGALLYLTYLGGSSNDGAIALAVDASGNAYVAGATTSQDFPTKNAFQATFHGAGGTGEVVTGDAFVAKLNPSGNQLLYSTYLGGSMDDIANAIVVDGSGNAYVAGATLSLNFPITGSAYQKTMKGYGGEPIRPSTGQPGWDPGDAFVVKLDSGGQLAAGTYFGGAQDDVAFTIALDASGNIYIGGATLSSNLPATATAISRTFGGTDPQNEFLNTGDGFVAEFDPTLATLKYATYFGGAGDDTVTAMAIDGSGNIYITGSTSTQNLTTSPGAFQSHYAGYFALPELIEQLYGDAYVAKINPSSSAPIYLTYLGGSKNDAATSIALDSAGDAYITGWTDSMDFPRAGNPLQSILGGDGGQGLYIYYGDVFLAVLNPSGTGVLYGSYFGGNRDDEGYGLALDSSGNVYVAGNTMSTNLPTTSNAFQKTFAGGAEGEGGIIYGDALYIKFSGLIAGLPSIAGVANAESYAPVIAPNTWVAIQGSNLAPDTRTWQASDFVNNQMPTALDGVSVTMNGEKAFVYYISGSQINILTPPDLAAGTVSIQVNNNGATSATFSAPAQTLSEAFFTFNGAYVAATHANNSLIGPTTLYPGSSTPAQAGETIVVYANGFGVTTPPVVSGSEQQSGVLPTLPVVTIGGKQAKVVFAGVVSPGLYQFNMVVPSSAVSGDNSIQAAYNGQTTQSGALITIK